MRLSADRLAHVIGSFDNLLVARQTERTSTELTVRGGPMGGVAVVTR